ncbi:MAG: SH3 domain-containing protein [Devosia sp.]
MAVPALAIGGLIGVVSVLVGLQCGGLDKCFFRAAPEAVAVVEPAEAAEPVAEERLVADPVVASVEPAPEVDPAAQQIADVIGGSFAAVKANDRGWLDSARALTAVADAALVVEEGDGPGPTAVAAAVPPGSRTAAATAIETAIAPVIPLDRPEPLEVSAYANPTRTPAAVSADAQAELDAVAAANEPKAELEPAADEPATEVATAEPEGDLRTVAGSGVNVRSGPGRSNGTLFTLAGGKQVRVLANQNGWLQITDDQNRTGWAYQTYLN